MPKSDTWPGGTGLEAIDSSGSCDSVLSTNSGFSDDSLEYLSAEEKACLMFLEETIDSLDTEDDSGLSNDDETEQKPGPGTVASKQAELTASFNRNATNSEQKASAQHSVKTNVERNLPSYLVPTPFVVANSSQSSTAKPSVAPKKNKVSKPTCDISDKEVGAKICAAPPPVPLEVNVSIPPKTQQHSGKAVDVSSQRGPLSYDALVYLRKNASEKKTPLCPSLDHTVESVNRHTTTAGDNGPVQSNISRFDRFHPEFSQSRTIPPAVPPKPKRTPGSSETKSTLSSSHSFSVKRTPNPEIVRQEALQKLGLIEESNETPASTSTAKAQNSLAPARSRFGKTPTSNSPMRGPSFCVTRLPRSRGLQSSASFHHASRPDASSATRHRTNGLSSSRNGPHRPVQAEPQKGLNSAQSSTPKPSSAVGYTVMVVPGMGADRREALRKLGLLKD
ncbi:uncharacterized protein [Eucyclogobius newberryi]|uniref:uncharacterized protein n=1 Tax=Eucyclogobius newberryi TaxID=166745 RepID=UPI003B5B8A39